LVLDTASSSGHVPPHPRGVVQVGRMQKDSDVGAIARLLQGDYTRRDSLGAAMS
jgi:hypothetical protein